MIKGLARRTGEKHSILAEIEEEEEEQQQQHVTCIDDVNCRGMKCVNKN